MIYVIGLQNFLKNNFIKEPIFINFTLKLDRKATLKGITKAVKISK